MVFWSTGRCQGQTSGLRARRHETLSLMGGGAASTQLTPHASKQGCVCGDKAGGVCQAERHGKQLAQVVSGEVLPRDGSLLMGAFPIRCRVQTA